MESIESSGLMQVISYSVRIPQLVNGVPCHAMCIRVPCHEVEYELTMGKG